MACVDLKRRFGLTIKNWRGKSGISQEELAWRAGLHRSYVADIERGVRNASLQSIEKLANALEVSISALFEPLGECRGTARVSKPGIGKDELLEILLVEDNSDDVKLTLRAFQRARLKNRIHVASDGAEALEYLFNTGRHKREPLQNRPQLILLDLNLPKVGGLEVLRRIKSDKRTRTIPVIVLTLSHDSKDIIQSRRLGAQLYIAKPVSFQRFCELTPKLSCDWALLRPRAGLA